MIFYFDTCVYVQVENLGVQKEARRQDWENFMVQQCQRSARVDQEYFDSVAQMKAYYSDLEDKLKQPAPVTPWYQTPHSHHSEI